MQIEHKALRKLLQQAYSAEKAAAFAYQGHAGSVKDPEQKKAIRQIEIDEWNHRKEVLLNRRFIAGSNFEQSPFPPFFPQFSPC